MAQTDAKYSNESVASTDSGRLASAINLRFAAVIRRGNRTLIAIALLGAVVSMGGLFLVWQVSGPGCRDVSLFVQFAGLPGSGSEEMLTQARGPGWDCASAPLQAALLADLLLIVGYLVFSTAVILGGWWRYDAPKLVAAAKFTPFLPLVVAVLDLVENGLSSIAIGGGDFKQLGTHPILRPTITTLASAKWSLALVLVLVTIMSAMVWISRRGESIDGYLSRDTTVGSAPLYLPVKQTAPAHSSQLNDDPRLQAAEEMNRELDEDPPTIRDIGLSASGGGIRATAFTLGALQSLETAGAMGYVTRITAVSGGSWGATSWVLAKAARISSACTNCGTEPASDSGNVAESVIGRLLAKPDSSRAESGYLDAPWTSRVRYLFNGRGGVLGPLLWVLLCTMSTVLLIVGLTYAISWVPGFILGRTFLFGDSFHPRDPHKCDPSASCPIDLAFNNPGLFIAVAALTLLIGTSLFRWIAVTWKPSLVLMSFGMIVFFYTAVMPAFFSLMQRENFANGLQSAWKYLVAAVGLSTIGTQLWKIFGGDIQGRLTRALTKYLPRLLGVLLAFATTIGGLSVAYFTAVSADPPPSNTSVTAALSVAMLGALYLFAGPNRPSLNQIFSKRLGRSFDITAVSRDGVRPADAAKWPGSWAWLRAVTRNDSSTRAEAHSVPELVLCCSQQRNGVAPGGLPAESLTISPFKVTRGYESEATDDYLARAASVRYLGTLHEYGKLDLVAPWLAISGAAFSSAMGRSNLGSTNAVLAAFHANLGIWIPNIRAGTEGEIALGSRPRISYILKEVLGWYNPTDRYIFATDGGHWENLGLVEQLRASHRTIVCVDASGDPPGSFATLRQALDLATLELKMKFTVDDLDADLAPLHPVNGRLPSTLATCIRFTVETDDERPAVTGSIYYAKLQLSADMPAALRLYAKEDRRFPTYSTLKQFLTDEQFRCLVAAGNVAGTQICALLERDRVLPTRW